MRSTTKKVSAARIVKIVLASLWWTALVLLVILIANIFSAKIKGEVPEVFGYSVVNIITGSMEGDNEDSIPADTYILLKDVSPSKIKKGDVICFYSTDPSIYGMPNTHRVVKDPIVNPDGSIEFVTKGDANPTEDKYNATGDNLVGVYVKRLDGVTSFVEMLEGNGMIIMLIALQAAIVLMVASAIIKSKSSATDENSEEDGGEKG